MTNNFADGSWEELESKEWLDSLAYVIENSGSERTSRLLEELSEHARQKGVQVSSDVHTPYVNTVPSARQSPSSRMATRDSAAHTIYVTPCASWPPAVQWSIDANE